MWSPLILDIATRVLAKARAQCLMIATAESCTGGLVSGALTEIAGSSDAFACGFVTYSNGAKTALLGVPEDLLAEHGAVSKPVAGAMAEGALQASQADVSVSVTGIAGPGGGSPGKPVGLVHFASARRGQPTVYKMQRFGELGRAQVRQASVIAALEMLGDRL